MGKRRSTYGRRRSRSLGALPTHEVCKTIDRSLPPAERLQFLTQYALETAIAKCTDELIDDIDMDEFAKKLSQAQINTESEIEDQNLYNAAVANTGNENVTEANTSKLNMLKCKAAMVKMEKEKQEWDQLKAKYREDLQKEIDVQYIAPKYPVNEKKWNLPDYSNILEDVAFTESSINYQIERLKSTAGRINRSTKVTYNSIDGLNSQIQSYLESKLLADSPRKLLKDCFTT